MERLRIDEKIFLFRFQESLDRIVKSPTSIDFWRMRARPDLRWNTENSWIKCVYYMEKNVKSLCKCGEKVMCKQER